MTFPTADEWYERFTSAPGAMYDLLRLMLSEVEYVQRREVGEQVRRSGVPSGGSMEDIYRVLYPQFSVKPFGEALKDVQGGRSLRWISRKAGMNQGLLTRLMRGERRINEYQMECIAEALRISPAYFREYREYRVVEALRDLLDPTASITAYKRLVARK